METCFAFSILTHDVNGESVNRILLNSSAFVDFIALRYRSGTKFQIAGSTHNDGEYVVETITNEKQIEVARNNNFTEEILPPARAR